MADVARKCQLSLATVSLVLNGRDSTVRISDSTRNLVLAAARELGYTPNIAARRLRADSGQANQYIIALASVLETPLTLLNHLAAAAHDLFSGPNHDVQLVVHAYRRQELGRSPGFAPPGWFHGAVITNTGPADEEWLETAALMIPVVLFNRPSSRHSFVREDGEMGGRLVAQHLAKLGRRRIAVLRPEMPSRAFDTRLSGFVAELAEAGVAPPTVIHASGYDAKAGYSAIKPFLESIASPPDAIFCLVDLLVPGVYKALFERKLAVPNDISVIGYDDHELAAFLAPPLTTVSWDMQQAAASAWSILMDQVQGHVHEPIGLTMTPRLLVRSSCGASPAHDEWFPDTKQRKG